MAWCQDRCQGGGCRLFHLPSSHGPHSSSPVGNPPLSPSTCLVVSVDASLTSGPSGSTPARGLIPSTRPPGSSVLQAQASLLSLTVSVSQALVVCIQDPGEAGWYRGPRPILECQSQSLSFHFQCSLLEKHSGLKGWTPAAQ